MLPPSAIPQLSPRSAPRLLGEAPFPLPFGLRLLRLAVELGPCPPGLRRQYRSFFARVGQDRATNVRVHLWSPVVSAACERGRALGFRLMQATTFAAPGCKCTWHTCLPGVSACRRVLSTCFAAASAGLLCCLAFLSLSWLEAAMSPLAALLWPTSTAASLDAALDAAARPKFMFTAAGAGDSVPAARRHLRCRYNGKRRTLSAASIQD